MGLFPFFFTSCLGSGSQTVVSMLREAAVEVRKGKSVSSVTKAHSTWHVTSFRFSKVQQKLRVQVQVRSPIYSRLLYSSSQTVFSGA